MSNAVVTMSPTVPSNLLIPNDSKDPNATSLAIESLQKLVYSDKTQNNFENVLLVSTEVQEYQQFIDSANQNTLAVAYSRMSCKTELMELLRSKAQSLQRIGFVFHSAGNNEKAFLDGKSFFLANELANDSDNSDDYSENLQWLLDLISEFGLKNADFLACNTLNSDLWKSYYSFLTEKTGITVGASNTKTGNLKYGGNWIMESTGEDVERVYFTESIEYYKYLLATIGPIDGLYYSTDSPSAGQATVIFDSTYTTLTTVTIPASVTSGTVYDVVSIEPGAFGGCTGLASVSIPSSITIFGSEAFVSCTGLTSVTLEPGLTIIGNLAFKLCGSLGAVSIPSSITIIGNFAFASCSGLTSVNLVTGLQIIGNYAFDTCTGLATVSIPSSVTTINNNAFAECSSLTTVYFNATSTLPEMYKNSFSILEEAGLATAYYYSGVFEYGTSTPANNAYFQSRGFLDAQPQGGPSPIVCFKEGSRILTKNGYRYIQDLRKGDLIKTVLHNFVPVAMIGKRDIYHPAKKERIKDQLYKCTSEKYPEVFEELVITGCHSILVDQFASQEQREKTMEVNKIKMACVTEGKYRLPACVDDRASVYDKPGNYTIYHLALENPDYYMNYGIYANGLLVETCSKRYLKELSNMTLID